MAIVIVEQFNPIHGYWNKLYEVDSSKFDPNAPITINKYGGPYRTRIVGEVVIVEDVVEEIEDDTIEEVEVGEEEEVFEEDIPQYDDSRWK